MTHRAFIAWEGPSPVTGEPIVLIVTGVSANTKTGPMYQAWLLVRNQTPFAALKSNADRAICGDCVHRSGDTRTCYVSMFNGPIHIWRRFIDGFYPRLTPAQGSDALRGQSLRLTAYGDPAFVPFEIWQALLSQASGWAGYTHQWRTCDPRLQQLCMASVETLEELQRAQAAGWRTFRARPFSEPLVAGEFVCPASEEGGHRSTCATCQLCRGTSSPAKSVSILLHGRGAAPRTDLRGRYDQLRAELARNGVGDLVGGPAQVSRARLALSQFYRRRRQAVRIRSKTVAAGVVRFWVTPSAVSAVEPRP